MNKPKNSKIISHETENYLEIFFPMAGFSNYMAIVGLVGVMILSFPIGLLAYAVYASEGQYKIVSGLGSIPFLIGAVPFMIVFIYSFFSRCCLFIDSEKLIFIELFFNLAPYEILTIFRQDIKELNSKKHYVSKNLYFHSLNDVSTKSDLIIKTQTKDYSLNWYIKPDLSENEIEWLVNEVSNRLKLPVTKE